MLHRLICAIALAALVPASNADVMTFTFDYPEPALTPVGDAQHVEIPGCISIGQPGEPRLPVQGVTVMLPPGHALASVEVDPADPVILPGTYQVEVTQRQYPYSYEGPWEDTPLSPDLVESRHPFPPYRAANPHTGFMRGFSIATFTVHPVVYTPGTGEIGYYPRLTARVTTAPTAEAGEALATMYWGSPRDKARVAQRVMNASLLEAYPAERSLRDPGYDLLVVTSSSLQPHLNSYLAYRTVRGWRIAVETVESIYATYTGVDNPDKIRTCIKDYYTNHAIQHVLLAGDNEALPHRGLYNDPGGGYDDSDIAADLYFAGLDGTWNTDGDGLWGENALESDVYAEVFVARMCADNATEMANAYAKTVAYQSNPVVGECEKALMVGELLWDTSPPTYGDTYKEEIRLGASTHGYTTVGFPPNFTVNVLYDSQGTWSGTAHLRPLLNNGVHLVNHLGHADVTYYMKLYNSDLTDATLTNDGVNHSFYLTYSQGCYCGSFDNRTTSGGYTSDCINERIVFELAHGAVATIANSRYGWGAYNSTNGSSQYYDRQFFDAVFGEGITNIAEANQDSKEDNVPFLGFEQNRWCYYELNVLGDPLLDIWTAAPTVMAVNNAAAYVIGEGTFTVSVPGVAGARVALSRDGVLLGAALTDGSGTAIVAFDAPPQTPGPMDLYVTAHNRLEHHDTVEVISPSGPYVVAIAHNVDDDMTGGSFGDGDGEVELGETVQFGVQLKNVGVDPAPGVVAVASCASPYVVFTQASQNFGNMPAGAEMWSPGDYVFSVSGNCPDRQGISIQIHATSGASSWDSYRSLLINAPVLALQSFAVTEVSGNGDGRPDAGETVQIVPSVRNNGHGTAWNVAGLLSTADGYTTITTAAATFPDVSPGNSGGASPLVVQFSPSTPLAHLVTFDLALSASGGYSTNVSFVVCVGQKPLLFVDADNEAHDNRIVQALNGLGETYDSWLLYSAGSPGLQELMKYRAILWAAGDQNQSSCSAQDRADLAAYLDNGGALLFSAENYLSSYAGDSFTSQYLHAASYQTNVSGVTNVQGVPGDPIGDGLQVALSYPSDLSDYPDSVGPDPTATTVFRMTNNGKSAVIRYPATGEAAYRVIFFATPLEAFSVSGSGENTIAGVIARSLSWLRGSGGDLQAPTAPAWAGMGPAGTLTWAPATDNVGVTAYRVYRSAAAYFDVGTLAPFATTAGTSLTLTEGIGDPDVNFFYAVTAVDAAENESAASPTVGEHDFVVQD